MKPSSIAASATLLVMLSGCTLIPDFMRPDVPTPTAWPTGEAYPKPGPGEADQKLAGTDWHRYFSDPKLRQVIALSLSNNRDLRVAALNIEKAQAQSRISQSDLFPKVNGEGSGDIERVGRRNSLTGSAETTHTYTASLGVSSFELDLFGRLRSLNEQSVEQYLSTVEARRATQISLVSEVASDYLTLEADQSRLSLAKKTLESDQQSLDLTTQMYQSGEGTILDVRQAETSVDSAKVDIEQFTTSVAQDLNALTLLVGATVPVSLLPGDTIEPVTTMTSIPADVPSEVLTSRPDILEAEHTLKAANANIGAARAAFFPKITLTSSTGSTSDALATLFKAGTGGWAFAPDIVLPIFDWGENQANLDVAKLDKRIDVANYEKSIQTAFREVADALAERGTIDQQVAAQEALVRSSEESYRLSSERYQQGLATHLDVLDSQRSLYSAQQNLISINLGRENNLVALYKVFGGGWQAAESS
ncbi:MAG TPA: efflux transporter outer membrane subunit [Bradyrhizobium sp.]|nr:efflux transporter outer membrane subunit [Bradyrhizobium sp.]